MICSTNFAMRQLLALGAAEIDRLLEHARVHLEDPAGHQIVERRHALEQRDVLKGPPDALDRRLVRPHLLAGLALVGDRALLGLVEAVDHVEHRRLAGAVGADDGADLALHDVEADVGERAHAAEAERDAADLEQHLVEAARLTGAGDPCARRRHGRAYSAASWTSVGSGAASRIAISALILPVRPSSKVTSVSTATWCRSE